jgi:cytochrome c55X
MKSHPWLTTLIFCSALPVQAEDLSAARQKELTHFVRQECGFCHGLKLTGGLGSPLTAAAMKDKPAETLSAVILHGIPGTAMPGWAPYLSEADATWIATELLKGFPE